MRAYKIQLVQELKPNDHQAHSAFGECIQNEMATDRDFHKNILFSDEAQFWLNGHVNKQNCRIWSVDNTRRRYILKKSLFGVLYGQRKSLVYISSLMKTAIMLRSIRNAIELFCDVDTLWFQQDGTAEQSIY